VAPAWTPPTAVPGLPFGPGATLRAALAAAGLEQEAYLRGASLAGWGAAGQLLIVTRAALPPAVGARLRPRLEQGLRRVLGRPVVGALLAVADLAAVGAEA
jgi:hypothetical protein